MYFTGCEERAKGELIMLEIKAKLLLTFLNQLHFPS